MKSKYIKENGQIVIIDNFIRVVNGNIDYARYPVKIDQNWFGVCVVENGYLDVAQMRTIPYESEQLCKNACEVLNKYNGFLPSEVVKLVGVSMGKAEFTKDELMDISTDEVALRFFIQNHPAIAENFHPLQVLAYIEQLNQIISPEGRTKGVLKLDKNFHVYSHGMNPTVGYDDNGWHLMVPFTEIS